MNKLDLDLTNKTNKIGLLIHIPKTAGRAISKVFLKDNLYVRRGHATALFTKDKFFKDREDEWNRLYKIAWVRNPWERATSLWKFTYLARTNSINHKSKYKNILEVEKNIIEGCSFIDNFKFWLFNYDIKIPPVFCKDYPYNRNPLKSLTYISDLDGNLLVDFIGRFEHIDKDIDKLNKKFNHNYKIPKSDNSDRKLFAKTFLKRGFGTDYQDFYDDESREYIADVCKWEIKKFNYKFEKKA